MGDELRGDGLFSVGFSRETPGAEAKERPAFEIIKPSELRSQIRQRTLELVERVRDEDIEVVFFLDKSARPISWLFNELWKKKYPECPIPKIHYVNIGRQHSLYKRTDYPVGLEKDNSVPERDLETEEVKRLQEVFGGKFTGKAVLIVDEYGSTGRSLGIAKKLFNKAFPDTRIDGKHLFQVEVDDFSKMPWMDLPGATGVWEVDNDTLFTRGINEKAVEKKLAILDGRWENEAGKDEAGVVHHLLSFSQPFAREVAKDRFGRTLEKRIKTNYNDNLALCDELSPFVAKLRGMDRELPSSKVSKADLKKYILDIFVARDALEVLAGKLRIITKKERSEDKDVGQERQSFLEDINFLVNQARGKLNLFLSSPNLEREYEIIKEIVFYQNVDISKLKELSQQLRREIKMMAEEDVTLPPQD
jgi:hypothetical protein